MKIDPYKHKEKYLNWKEKVKNGIPDISKFNSDLILRYLDNMEHGINISSTNKKGCRSFIRLNTLREKMVFFAKNFKGTYNLDRIIDIREEDLLKFFSEMKNGNFKRKDKQEYRDISTFVKVFKAFWHWHQKVNRKNGDEIIDISVDLDPRQEKPKWVYLTEEQVKELYNNAKYEYRVLIMFLFDTGIRSPTELINIKVSDLYNDCKELQIREEISKTFGRKIKLMLCSELLKDYIKSQKLKNSDHLFLISPPVVNRYLQRLATRVLGDVESLAGQKYSELTMYDFRHISCCYWLPRYKSESALKYRFGWKKSDKIHYYSEMLGMKDTISEDDMLVDMTKTEIEKKLEKSEKEKYLMQERMQSMEEQMKKILEVVEGMCEKAKG
jgi:integrase